VNSFKAENSCAFENRCLIAPGWQLNTVPAKAKDRNTDYHLSDRNGERKFAPSGVLGLKMVGRLKRILETSVNGEPAEEALQEQNELSGSGRESSDA